MSRIVRILLILLCLLFPLNAFAMKHDDGDDDKDKNHSEMRDGKYRMDHDDSMKGHDMSKMDHDSMEMGADEIPLGEVVVDGVRARAYLLNVRDEMEKHGMKTSHHIMVRFADAETGEPLTKGRAAVKVREGHGDETKAQKMMRMDGAFGVDLALDESGHYRFRVGTKLKGEKRTFEFEYGMMSHK